MKNSPMLSVVQLNLSTDTRKHNAGTREILVDKANKHLFTKNTLCRIAPDGNNVFVVRDQDGNFICRETSTGVGIALAPYMFGRNNMRRVNKDFSDYTSLAYNMTSGRPSPPIIRLPTVDDVNRHITITRAAKTAEPVQLFDHSTTKQHNPPTKRGIEVPYSSVEQMSQATQANRAKYMRAVINCPQCGNDVIKDTMLRVFCRPNGGGPSPCKSAFYSRKQALAYREANHGKKQDIVQRKSTSRSAPFKTINGIELSKSEFIEVIGSTKDKPNFKSVLGIPLSLAEVRSLVSK